MENKSKSFSLEGWSFKKWFLGNWSSIKELGKVGGPFIIAFVATKDPALSGFVAIVGKFVLDLGHYYFKSYVAKK